MSNITKRSLLNPSLEYLSSKEFMTKLLNGVAGGIVVGLIPNAILGEIFKALLPFGDIFKVLLNIVVAAQFTVPILIGVLCGIQFKFNPIEVACLGIACFLASGVLVLKEQTFTLVGVGDLINTMLTAGIGVLFIRFMSGRLGSLTIILLPILVSVLIGGLGVFLLPYVKQITATIGLVIANFLKLQPLLMCILLACTFAIIIVSPVSTVAIALAIQISGLGSGAANLGIASCAMTLVVGSMYVNKIGISLTLFLGSMKLFMGNWLRNPIMNIPIILNGIWAGILVFVFNIQGTPASAGFGFSGLVGPINAFKFMNHAPMLRVLILFLVYFVFTGLGAYLIDFVCVKVLKLYKHDIYYFEMK